MRDKMHQEELLVSALVLRVVLIVNVVAGKDRARFGLAILCLWKILF